MSVARVSKALAAGLLYRPLLLIYQMGKVGSQTIEATLRAMKLPHLIYRPHFLARGRLEIMRDRLRNASMPDYERESLREQLAEATLLHHTLQIRNSIRKILPCIPRVHIITGIREPVSQILATLFQLHGTYFGEIEKITPEACRDLLLVAPGLDPQRADYMKRIRAGWGQWFDVELKSVLGIDVYAYPFSCERGYSIIENKWARALVYRFENFSALGKMLEHFLGRPVPAIINQNISTEKEYAARYQMVKDQLRLPATFLDEQYDRKCPRHFYGDAEIESFKQRWQHGAMSKTAVTGGTRPKPGIEVFLTPDALALNEARLAHLGSLGLQLRGKKVLEVGGGIGLHTCFFESLKCDVLFTDGRAENVAQVNLRYPHRKTAILDLEKLEDLSHLGAFDIIYCYGTLYHLSQPAKALRALANICREMILLETCVTPGNGDATHLEKEPAENPNQAASGLGCRPTRPWVLRTLKENFGHAYTTVHQPAFHDFETDWAHPAQRKLYRAIFVASRQPLQNPQLTESLPDHTPAATESPETTTKVLLRTIELNEVLRALNIARLDRAKNAKPEVPVDMAGSADVKLEKFTKIKLEGTAPLLSEDAAGKAAVIDFLSEHGFALISEQQQSRDGEENLTFVRLGS
jgi:2-polyprenyl-3-methyl-5-hydroxy-6-metoxy-1,4-benzoquinol methylase